MTVLIMEREVDCTCQSDSANQAPWCAITQETVRQIDAHKLKADKLSRPHEREGTQHG
jgi:hypothetical protein